MTRQDFTSFLLKPEIRGRGGTSGPGIEMEKSMQDSTDPSRPKGAGPPYKKERGKRASKHLEVYR